MVTILALTSLVCVLIVLGLLAHHAGAWARDHRRRVELRAMLITSRRGGRNV